MSHFPAEFPKDCVVALAKIAMSGDVAQLISADAVDHALYAIGCLNALRFEEKTPVFSATATAIPPWAITLAIELARRILERYFGDKPETKLAMDSADDASSLETVELGEKLHEAFAA